MDEDSKLDTIRRQLDEIDWNGDLAKVVSEAMKGDAPTEGLAAVALVAWNRAETDAAAAVRLAVATLGEAAPPDPEEEDRDALDLDAWARWRLHMILRDHADKKSLAALSEEDRERVSPPEAEPIELTLADLDAVEQEVTERLSGEQVAIADGLCAIAQALEDAPKGAPKDGILRASRTALIRVEKSGRDLSDEGVRAVLDLRERLWSRLVAAWVRAEDDDPETVTTRRWLTGSSGGMPRTHKIKPEWLSAKQRNALLELLEGKHERSQTSQSYGLELLRLGKAKLSIERRVALAKEVNAVGPLVEAYLEDGRHDDAVKVALDEARSTSGSGEPLVRATALEESGLQDEAIELMRIVIERSVDVRHFEWLAGRLVARGDKRGALEVRKQLFDSRCGLTTYEQLRDHAPDGDWPELRQELLNRLEERRLFRIILDIAFAEKDVELAKSCVPQLDEHQQEYVRQRLDAREDPFSRELSEVIGEAAREAVGTYSPRESLPPPERVKHKKYGVGDVLSHSGDGEHRKLEIDFKHFGTKTILERFVEPLDD